MSTYIPPYGRGGAGPGAGAAQPHHPLHRDRPAGGRRPLQRGPPPVTQLKVNAFSPPAGSVRREYIVSDDQTFAVGNTVRINLVLSGADAIYLDELAVMFRDASDTDREALLDADTNHDRLKAANTDLLISVGWQVVDGAATTPTVTIHPWTFASAAAVIAALTGTDPVGMSGHVVTLQNLYDARATIVQAADAWTEAAAGVVERASLAEAQATSGHSNDKGLSVLRGWQQIGAWWASIGINASKITSGMLDFARLPAATQTEAERANSSDNDSVMSPYRTNQHFEARVKIQNTEPVPSDADATLSQIWIVHP